MKRDALEDPATRLVADLAHALRYALTGAPDHEGRFEDGAWENWSRTYAERPAQVVAPEDEAALCMAVADARRLRVVGGGHSFNATPLCADTMLTLDAMAGPPCVDARRGRVRVGAGVRVRDLNRALWAQGWALPVLGSTDAQSIGGLIATDLHGTGRDHRRKH
jgi:L-gulonolactone oxidase